MSKVNRAKTETKRSIQQANNKKSVPSSARQADTPNQADNVKTGNEKARFVRQFQRKKGNRATTQYLQQRNGQNEPVQRKVASGLPDKLKSGVEALSGMGMDDVQVHYDSAKPAQLQAHAYAQGNQIHLGPGQERHLPHEAWHVVQQKQGRVKPTIQAKGIGINDDSAFEREADVMGAKAVNLSQSRLPLVGPVLLNPSRTLGDSPVQRAGITSKTVTEEETAVSQIKAITGVNAKDIQLPDTDGLASKTERPLSIEAEVTSATTRDGERAKHGNLSKVTGMARDEEFILLGADLKGFYQAGHLIGDQLIGKLGKTYSFIMANLAPQVAAFNSPVYLNLMENVIKTEADSGKKVGMKVDLTYPPNDIKPTVQTLLDRGIVTLKQDKGTHVDIESGKSNVSKDAELPIPRRIPNSWKLTAKIQGGKEFPAMSKGIWDNSTQGYKKPGTGLNTGINYDDPFHFTMADSVENIFNINFPQKDTREITAVQWNPPKESEIKKEDILAAMKSVFPDTVKNDIYASLLNLVKQKSADDIFKFALEYFSVLKSSLELPFLSGDQLAPYNLRIGKIFGLARTALLAGKATEMEIQLKNCEAVFDDLREFCVDFREQVDNFRRKQGEVHFKYKDLLLRESKAMPSSEFVQIPKHLFEQRSSLVSLFLEFDFSLGLEKLEALFDKVVAMLIEVEHNIEAMEREKEKQEKPKQQFGTSSPLSNPFSGGVMTLSQTFSQPVSSPVPVLFSGGGDRLSMSDGASSPSSTPYSARFSPRRDRKSEVESPKKNIKVEKRKRERSASPPPRSGSLLSRSIDETTLSSTQGRVPTLKREKQDLVTIHFGCVALAFEIIGMTKERSRDFLTKDSTIVDLLTKLRLELQSFCIAPSKRGWESVNEILQICLSSSKIDNSALHWSRNWKIYHPDTYDWK